MDEYIEMASQVKARISTILDALPEDKVTEKYEASALRDYTQTLINRYAQSSTRADLLHRQR